MPVLLWKLRGRAGSPAIQAIFRVALFTTPLRYRMVCVSDNRLVYFPWGAEVRARRVFPPPAWPAAGRAIGAARVACASTLDPDKGGFVNSFEVPLVIQTSRGLLRGIVRSYSREDTFTQTAIALGAFEVTSHAGDVSLEPWTLIGRRQPGFRSRMPASKLGRQRDRLEQAARFGPAREGRQAWGIMSHGEFGDFPRVVRGQDADETFPVGITTSSGTADVTGKAGGVRIEMGRSAHWYDFHA